MHWNSNWISFMYCHVKTNMFGTKLGQYKNLTGRIRLLAVVSFTLPVMPYQGKISAVQ